MVRFDSFALFSWTHRMAEFIFRARPYPLVFSIVFSLLAVFNFYPAILFSDSVGRWIAATHLANSGFDAFSEIDSRSPLIPLFIMAGAFRLTGEIGFFHWAQSFLFSLTLFRFSQCFLSSWISNVATSLFLLLPLSVVYSVFSSYDVIFAIALLNACLYLTKTPKTLLDGVWLGVWFAIAIGTRFPSILLVPVMLYALMKLRGTFINPHAFRTAIGTVAVLSAATIAMPFGLSQKQPDQNRSIAFNASPFFDGIAWEYQNYATKSSSPRDAAFLRSIGVKKEELASEISYSSIWRKNSAGFRFMDSVPYTKRWELLRNYCLFALREPHIFLVEKLKYLSDLMGFSGPIANAEIGKWRGKYKGREVYKENFAKLGFNSNPRKEFIVDVYFSFMSGPGALFLRPFIVMTFILIALPALYRVNISIKYCALLFFIYYFAYLVNSASHELRYFFPVIYFLMACVPPALGLVLGSRGELRKLKMRTVQAENDSTSRRGEIAP